jgi:hypothetical protein
VEKGPRVGKGKGRRKGGAAERADFIFHYEIRRESCLLSIKTHD